MRWLESHVTRSMHVLYQGPQPFRFMMMLDDSRTFESQAAGSMHDPYQSSSSVSRLCRLQMMQISSKILEAEQHKGISESPLRKKAPSWLMQKL